MMKARAICVLALGALILRSVPAAADPVGSITGTIYDQVGTPLRGIKVTATSDSKIGGPRTAYTNDEGYYRITGLVPGKFTLIAEAPKLKKYVQKNLKVGASEPTAVDIIMEVETEVVEVKICEKAPTISTTTANVRETFDEEFLNRVPTQGRSFQGVTNNNTYTVDGINTTDAVTHTFGTNFNFDAVADVEVQSGAYGGRNATATVPPARNVGPMNTEAYASIPENPFLPVAGNPLSTFSIDVDTASYANVRRFIQDGALPPPDAVRIEELLNNFSYTDVAPRGNDPFGVAWEVGECPWNRDHRLVRLGLKARDVPPSKRPAANLVFLVDVSGSMMEPNKLPLVQRSLRMLTEHLETRDRVAIVVYAGNSGLALPSTPASDRVRILDAIDRLQGGGSTNGAEGIQLAYQVATKEFIKGGINRVILATDGDFNVGVTSEGELVRLIEGEAKTGVFLTVLGFGMGNLKDATMEKLADKGNGNYAYVDSLGEARKLLVEQLGGTLVTVAKDVKIQVEWNPTRVGAYRLIGYENRMLRAEDFNDDKKDAGEIGAGLSVTALYEIAPPGKAAAAAAKPAVLAVDPLRYQSAGVVSQAAASAEVMTLKVRFKEPAGEQSRKLEWAVTDRGANLAAATTDFRFAASVAAFGMLLRKSAHRGSADWDLVTRLASGAVGDDPGGHRHAFVALASAARGLDTPVASALSRRAPR